jgi:hypothetical protein
MTLLKQYKVSWKSCGMGAALLTGAVVRGLNQYWTPVGKNGLKFWLRIQLAGCFFLQCF